MVGSLGLITFSTAVSMTDGSRYTDSIRSSSSTEPDTSALANGGVFLHTGSWLTPLARITSIVWRTESPGLTYNSDGVLPRVSSTAAMH